MDGNGVIKSQVPSGPWIRDFIWILENQCIDSGVIKNKSKRSMHLVVIIQSAQDAFWQVNQSTNAS